MENVALTLILNVENVEHRLAHYRDVLGFKNGFRWSEPEQRMLAPEEAP